MVSVLFVDLVGFTSYSEHRDPEEVRELITEYFDLAREAVGQFGGTVDKFIGDAVMAWWGATTSEEDDAERAVRTALEIVDRVLTLGERHSIPDLAARAGVMTGEASVGPGGNEKSLLLGDLVNSASRMQSLAAPGTVFVGEATAALVGRSIELAPAGTHQVKGKDEPLAAWRAIRVVSERGGKRRGDVLEPPFVGRDAELRLLKDTLHATGREHRARLVSLIGQAGIGKSRLIWEFQKYVDGLAENVYWHEGRSPAYGDGLALWALGEMIRGRARIQETDPDDVTALRLSEAVATYLADGERRAWVEQRLAALLGLGDSVGGERTELFAAARAFVEAIAEHGTTVLVFEDLHWADPSLLQFIEELPDWSQNHPILIVTMARPDLLDRRPDWGTGRRGFASMYLGPLGTEDMRDLVRGAVPGIPDPAVERIAEAADGVPLFAVEMLRMLIGEGRLQLSDGTVTITGDLSSIEVPTSVQAVIAARLDRLPFEERDLVRDAAVVGHSFTLEGIAALRDEEPDKLDRRLGDLVRREVLELIRDPRSPERGQYQWVQSMLREVAYGRISRTDRRELHMRAARYFRDLDDPELAPVAAAHYVAAFEHSAGADPTLHAELADSLRAAIARAETLHAHEQILSLVETALPVMPPDVAAELREKAALAAVRLGDPDDADLHVQALMALAEASGETALLHRAVAVAGKVANENRQADRAAAVLEPHLARFPDLASDPNLARAAVYLARARMLLGDEAGSAELADSALGAVEQLGMLEEIADAMVTLGTSLAGRRIHQGMALLRGAVEMCRRHDLMDTKLRGLINIGYASVDLDETVAATREAFEESKRVGDRNHADFVAGNLVGLSFFLFDLDTVETLVNDPLLGTTPVNHMGILTASASLAAWRGDDDRARRLLEEARARASEISDAQALQDLERTEARMAFFDGDYRDAFETGARHYSESPFAPGLAAATAIEGAVFDGDEGRIRQAREMAVALPAGVLTTPPREMADAVLTLLDGHVDDAMHLADASMDRLAEQGLAWDEFTTAAAMARHLPPGPDRDRYLERARGLAQKAGADGLTVWLDGMPGPPPTVD
jgi:class 3 adenylate cyclase/tetratricopeptide (TPR) repeat protein